MKRIISICICLLVLSVWASAQTPTPTPAATSTPWDCLTGVTYLDFESVGACMDSYCDDSGGPFGGAILCPDSSDAYHGLNSLSFTTTGVPRMTGMIKAFRVIPGHDYRIGVWSKVSSMGMTSVEVLLSVSEPKWNSCICDESLVQQDITPSTFDRWEWGSYGIYTATSSVMCVSFTVKEPSGTSTMVYFDYLTITDMNQQTCTPAPPTATFTPTPPTPTSTPTCTFVPTSTPWACSDYRDYFEYPGTTPGTWVECGTGNTSCYPECGIDTTKCLTYYPGPTPASPAGVSHDYRVIPGHTYAITVQAKIPSSAYGNIQLWGKVSDAVCNACTCTTITTGFSDISPTKDNTFRLATLSSGFTATSAVMCVQFIFTTTTTTGMSIDDLWIRDTTLATCTPTPTPHEEGSWGDCALALPLECYAGVFRYMPVASSVSSYCSGAVPDMTCAESVHQIFLDNQQISFTFDANCCVKDSYLFVIGDGTGACDPDMCVDRWSCFTDGAGPHLVGPLTGWYYFVIDGKSPAGCPAVHDCSVSFVCSEAAVPTNTPTETPTPVFCRTDCDDCSPDYYYLTVSGGSICDPGFDTCDCTDLLLTYDGGCTWSGTQPGTGVDCNYTLSCDEGTRRWVLTYLATQGGTAVYEGPVGGCGEGIYTFLSGSCSPDPDFFEVEIEPPATVTPTPTATPTAIWGGCSAAPTVSCSAGGVMITYDYTWDDVSSYCLGSVNALGCHESVYEITVPGGYVINTKCSADCTGTWIFLLSACDPDSCVKAAYCTGSGAGFTSSSLSAGTYYLVIDSAAPCLTEGCEWEISCYTGPSPTPVPTYTPTRTPTRTPTLTSTPTITPTPTNTSPATDTPTPTPTIPYRIRAVDMTSSEFVTLPFEVLIGANNELTILNATSFDTRLRVPIVSGTPTPGSTPGPRGGELVYDSATQRYYYWDGAAWSAIGGAVSNLVFNNTVYVDSTVPADIPGLIYDTVGEAITYVTGQSPIPGDKWQIIIAPGQYGEDSLVAPPYTTLSAMDTSRGAVRIYGTGANPVIIITDSGVILNGLRIENQGGNAPALYLRGPLITNALPYDPLIKECYIRSYSCEDGIVCIDGTVFSRFEDCEIVIDPYSPVLPDRYAVGTMAGSAGMSCFYDCFIGHEGGGTGNGCFTMTHTFKFFSCYIFADTAFGGAGPHYVYGGHVDAGQFRDSIAGTQVFGWTDGGDGGSDITDGQLSPNSIQAANDGDILQYSTASSAWEPVPGSGSSTFPAFHNTVYVDVSVGVDIPGLVYDTINEACAYVTTQSPSSDEGWLIRLAPGVYTDTGIDVPTYTTLCGFEADSPILKGDGSHPILAHTQNYSSVQNIRVDNTASSGSGNPTITVDARNVSYDNVYLFAPETTTGMLSVGYVLLGNSITLRECTLTGIDSDDTFYLIYVDRGNAVFYECDLTTNSNLVSNAQASGSIQMYGCSGYALKTLFTGASGTTFTTQNCRFSGNTFRNDLNTKVSGYGSVGTIGTGVLEDFWRGELSPNILIPGTTDADILAWDLTDSQWKITSPATLSPVKYPAQTRTVYVDAGVSADVAGLVYDTITEACAYVVSQAPVDASRWLIKIAPGTYSEQNITCPAYTTMLGEGASPLSTGSSSMGSVRVEGDGSNSVFISGILTVFKGLIVRGSDEPVISVSGHTVGIEDCSFSSTALIAGKGVISSSVASAITVRDSVISVITGAGNGVYVGGSASANHKFFNCQLTASSGSVGYSDSSSSGTWDFHDCKLVSSSGTVFVDNSSAAPVFNVWGGHYSGLALRGANTRVDGYASNDNGVGDEYDDFSNVYSGIETGITVGSIQQPANPQGGEILRYDNNEGRWVHTSGGGADLYPFYPKTVHVDTQRTCDSDITGKLYSSVSSACTYVATQSPSSSNRWTILVHAGTDYTVSNVTLPTYTTIKSFGSSQAVLKNTGGNPILTLDGTDQVVENLTFYQSAVNRESIRVVAQGARVIDCTIYGNPNGGYGVVSVENSTSCLFQDCRIIAYTGGTTNNYLAVSISSDDTSDPSEFVGCYISNSEGDAIQGSGSYETIFRDCYVVSSRYCYGDNDEGHINVIGGTCVGTSGLGGDNQVVSGYVGVSGYTETNAHFRTAYNVGDYKLGYDALAPADTRYDVLSWNVAPGTAPYGWRSQTPDEANLVDKSTTQTITGNKLSTGSIYGDIYANYSARTVYVDAMVAANIAGYAYNDLGDAVTYVATQSPGVGTEWTIFVAPGVYSEVGLAFPQYLSVIGLGKRESCVIQGDGSTYIFRMQDGDVLRNLEIRSVDASAPSSFIGRVSADVVIDNCYIHGPCETYVVWVDSASTGVRIINSKIIAEDATWTTGSAIQDDGTGTEVSHCYLKTQDSDVVEYSGTDSNYTDVTFYPVSATVYAFDCNSTYRAYVHDCISFSQVGIRRDAADRVDGTIETHYYNYTTPNLFNPRPDNGRLAPNSIYPGQSTYDILSWDADYWKIRTLDASNVVDKSSAQSISGEKTFSGGLNSTSTTNLGDESGGDYLSISETGAITAHGEAKPYEYMTWFPRDFAVDTTYANYATGSAGDVDQQRHYITFADGGDGVADVLFHVPSNYDGGLAYLEMYWSQDDTATGTLNFDIAIESRTLGEVMSGAATGSFTTTVNCPAVQEGLNQWSLEISSQLVADQMTHLIITRDESDSTNNSDIFVYYVRLLYRIE